MVKDAFLSYDRKYRYALLWTWDLAKLKVMFICLNPSTADEKHDNPTLKRCIYSTKSWNFGGVFSNEYRIE